MAKNYFIMDFAEWLKTNRKTSGLSLRRLADTIGNLCSDAYLSQLENRRYKGKKGALMQPAKEIVIALAETFGEDVDFALKLADYAPENPPKRKPQTAKEFFEILESLGIEDVRFVPGELETLDGEDFQELIDVLVSTTTAKIKRKNLQIKQLFDGEGRSNEQL